MQKEMKKLQTAKKEHSKMLRNQSQYESQIKTLRNEVTDMKKVKVSCSILITELHLIIFHSTRVYRECIVHRWRGIKLLVKLFQDFGREKMCVAAE